MMKMLFALILVFFGCSQQPATPSKLQSWMADNGKLKVLCTTAMIDDLVGQVGGERVDHLVLIAGEVDPHSYELVKGDDEKLERSHIVFCNGLGLEHGASLRYRLEHHPWAVALGEEICHSCPEALIHVDGQLDPHIWMDISLWSKAIPSIVAALSKADPEGAFLYEKNGAALAEQMNGVHTRISAALQKIPAAQRFLVTSHDAFNYFTRAYLAQPEEREAAEWQKRCAAPEGLAPEGQLSAGDIQGVINHLCAHRIAVVFPESNVSRDALRKIVSACTEKGQVVKISSQALYGDAMGPAGSDADTYLKMIEHNANLLVDEWNMH